MKSNFISFLKQFMFPSMKYASRSLFMNNFKVKIVSTSPSILKKFFFRMKLPSKIFVTLILISSINGRVIRNSSDESMKVQDSSNELAKPRTILPYVEDAEIQEKLSSNENHMRWVKFGMICFSILILAVCCIFLNKLMIF